MKPKIFLSHNKKDKDFIKKLANSLRTGRINVWYDDWEIPPGASLRAKIFEEGIPGCDLFFVYLTENSINSKWVKQELDAAFVTELEGKGGFLTLYVNNDDIRNELSLDLRSRRIPAINKDNVSKCLSELVALAWETFSKKQVKRVEDNKRIGMLELEKKVLEKENEINKLRLKSKEDLQTLSKDIKKLNKKIERLLTEFDKGKKAKVTTKITKRVPVKRASAKKRPAKLTDTDKVIKIIKRSKKGVDVPTLTKKTGFDAKKIRNIVHRAFKEGKIKRVGRGLYVGV